MSVEGYYYKPHVKPTLLCIQYGDSLKGRWATRTSAELRDLRRGSEPPVAQLNRLAARLGPTCLKPP